MVDNWKRRSGDRIMKSNKKEKIENTIKEVINVLAQDGWLVDEIPYKELSECETIASLVSLAEHKMSLIVLMINKLLEEKFITKLDNERFEYLQSLCFNASKLEKQIQRTEGSVCCVDKTHSRIADYLKGGEYPKAKVN